MSHLKELPPCEMVAKLSHYQKGLLIKIKNNTYFRFPGGWKARGGDFIRKTSVDLFFEYNLVTRKDTRYSYKLSLTSFGNRVVNIAIGKAQA